MVPQSDSPPKPLGATVPHSSLCRWKWAQKLKPLLLHSSEALDAYFWVRGFLGVDQHNHQKKSKILENRLNRLAGYENQTVLNRFRFWQKQQNNLHFCQQDSWLFKSWAICCEGTLTRPNLVPVSNTSSFATNFLIRQFPILLFFSKVFFPQKQISQCAAALVSLSRCHVW